MGQCVSSQEEERGVRVRGEEARSLITHEGGYQDGEATVRTGDLLARSARSRPRKAVNGRTTAVPTGERHGEGRGVPGAARERELSDVASGELEQRSLQVEASSSPTRSAVQSHELSQRGKKVMEELSKAYCWREQFDHPSSEFLSLMDGLYMECQLHLTVLSARGDVDSRREADTIVSEMVALRNYWGPRLLPSSTCNAFVRERIPLTLGVEQRHFRIDCAQFFEPVPFYSNQQRSSCPGELMKLYRFSVYNVATNDIVLRYYLERSKTSQYYHVLCFMDDNCHGQVKPYGTEPPPYWEVRQSMLDNLNVRLMNAMSPGTHPVPKPLAVTVFSANHSGN